MHSLHSYFLRGGDYAVPIVYDVERIRDGRSFLTRRVVARQHGRPIYYQTLNFQRPEEGYEHQDAMPTVGAPETGFDLVEVMRKGGNAEADALGKEWGSLDVRWLGNTRYGPRARRRARLAGADVGPAARGARATTRRCTPPRSPTPATSACSAPRSPRTAATRRRPRWRRSTTPSGSTGRSAPTSGGSTTSGRRPPRARAALAFGRVFTEDGTLVATVAQEGLIRPRSDDFEGPGVKDPGVTA